MSKKLFILLCAVLMGLSSAGLVSADQGLYVGVRGDVSFLNDSESSSSAGDYPALDLTAKTQTGFAVRSAVGYAFHNSFRVEGEVGYRRNGLNSMDVRSPGALVDLAIPFIAARTGNANLANTKYPDLKSDVPEQALVKNMALAAAKGTQDISGNASALTLLANGYYDFHFESGLKPYIGAGLGVAFISAEAENSLGTVLVDDSDAVFAYQAFAGIGYEIQVAGRPVTMLLDYSYFGSQNPTFVGKTSGREFESEFTGHYIGLGALIFFGD